MDHLSIATDYKESACWVSLQVEFSSNEVAIVGVLSVHHLSILLLITVFING